MESWSPLEEQMGAPLEELVGAPLEELVKLRDDKN